MSRFEFQDRLELVGILAGVFVILMALATLSGMPWATNENTLAIVVQLLGLGVMIAVGVALILAVYSGDVNDLIPGSDE